MNIATLLASEHDKIGQTAHHGLSDCQHKDLAIFSP